MSAKPRVLIFDDDAGWAEQIALSLQDGFNTTSITEPSDWNEHIRSTYWDAIVVDVQILGSDINGLEIAERSILEYEITTPVIVISVVPNLKEIEKKHGRVFFGYVRKTNYNHELPTLVNQACKPLGRSIYLHGMLTEFAKRFGVLHDILPDDMAGYDFSWVTKNVKGKTINDLIEIAGAGPKRELSNMARIVLRIIQWAKEKREC